MELVSNNSPEKIEANRWEQRANSTLLELTANLMRITRGAGKPELILNQVFDVAVAARRYFEITQQWPSVWGLLSVDDPRGGDDFHPERWATDIILRGALQTVASRLLGQIPQESMGMQELFQGVRSWADAVVYQADRPHQQQARSVVAPE